MRARTRLSARSSTPGSSKSTRSSTPAAMRKPIRTRRRKADGSARMPRKLSQIAAQRIAQASTSTHPGRVESEVSRQALYEVPSISVSDPAPLHDEGDVDLVFLVIEAQRVHGEVHAQPDGLLALPFPAGNDFQLPGAQGVAGKRPDQVVGRIQDRQAAADVDRLHVRARDAAAGGTFQQVEGLVEH